MKVTIGELEFEVKVTKSRVENDKTVITEMKYRNRKVDSGLWSGWFTAPSGHRYFKDLRDAVTTVKA